jgi:hypothetical protein
MIRFRSGVETASCVHPAEARRIAANIAKLPGLLGAYDASAAHAKRQTVLPITSLLTNPTYPHKRRHLPLALRGGAYERA